ncbi:MAG: hypothetical protein AAFY36_13445 [Bacteroidota bacterium]
MERLYLLIENPPEAVKGSIVDNHIILDIVAELQHYWSPQLNFRVEPSETDEDKSVVSGLIGPKPAVWTMFMFIYFVIGVVGFFISCLGLSKLLLGEYSNWLIAIPVTILLLLSAYLVGKYGEHLAKDQMEILKQFVREAVYYE